MTRPPSMPASYLSRLLQAARVALPDLTPPPQGFGRHRVTVWRKLDTSPERAWQVLSDWRAPYISLSGTGKAMTCLHAPSFALMTRINAPPQALA